MAVFWVVAPCSLTIPMMMEAASTSETLENFYQTTRSNNPEDSHLHTRRRENLKFHIIYTQYKESFCLPTASVASARLLLEVLMHEAIYNHRCFDARQACTI
jgi:hypothetical protein